MQLNFLILPLSTFYTFLSIIVIPFFIALFLNLFVTPITLLFLRAWVVHVGSPYPPASHTSAYILSNSFIPFGYFILISPLPLVLAKPTRTHPSVNPNPHYLLYPPSSFLLLHCTSILHYIFLSSLRNTYTFFYLCFFEQILVLTIIFLNLFSLFHFPSTRPPPLLPLCIPLILPYTSRTAISHFFNVQSRKLSIVCVYQFILNKSVAQIYRVLKRNTFLKRKKLDFSSVRIRLIVSTCLDMSLIESSGCFFDLG